MKFSGSGRDSPIPFALDVKNTEVTTPRKKR